MNSLLLLLILFSLSYVPQTRALTAPEYVRGEIEKEVVKVYWEHVETDPSFRGYYVIVEDVGSGQRESPVYVHVESDERCAKIIGLRPGTTYRLMVSAHSADTYKTSAPITIDTEDLEFLHADSLKVNNISNSSARFEWTHVAKNNIHHIKFKLLCIGIQTFSRNGDLMEERSFFKHESWSTSRGMETYIASGLLPNCHYTCHLVSVAGDRQSAANLAPQVTFHTAPGRPSRPPRPRLSVNAVGKRTSDFSVELYPTDDQFGPIDHYKIIAVPVTRGEDQPRTLPYKPVVEPSELLTQTLSRKLVTKVAERVPFFVGEFPSGELPPTLRISGKWVHKAFKHGTYYSFVVVAFTQSQSSTELLSSISEPADPPVLIGNDKVRGAVLKKRQVTHRFANIIMATMFSILGIFAVAFIIVFGTKYYQGSKRDAYYFAVNEDSSSDEDIVFLKKFIPAKAKNPLLKSHDPISPCPEGDSKAEWAVKNMYYNPAFEEMVYRSPEMMQEMEETMTMLAENRASYYDDEMPLEEHHQSLTSVTVHEVQEITELPSIEPQLEPNMPSIPPPPPPPPVPGLTEAPSLQGLTDVSSVGTPLPVTALAHGVEDLPLRERTDSPPLSIPGPTDGSSIDAPPPPPPPPPPVLGYMHSDIIGSPVPPSDSPPQSMQGYSDSIGTRSPEPSDPGLEVSPSPQLRRLTESAVALLPPRPPPPPPLPMQSTTTEEGQEGSPTAGDGEFTYKSLPCNPGYKNIVSSPRTGLSHPYPHLHTPATLSFPPYYFVTLNPDPGISLEEYNIASSAFPLTTFHRLQQPPKTPTSMQQQKRKRKGI